MTDALDFVFSHSSNGILIADADGRIEQVNPAASGLLDLPADQLIGGQVADCFRRNAALLSLFSHTGNLTLDVHLPRRRLASGMGTTLDDGRRSVMLQDVTEQRELDTRRESFVMTMAHDLRNPIAALIGYAELIHTVGSLNDEQQLFLSRVRDTATRLHDLAAELVDLAWVEAGMPLQSAPIALKQPIESVVAELAPMSQAKGITFFVSVQHPLPDIMGDPARIRMLIFKLIHNAILYSGAGQVVAVHAWSESYNGAKTLCCSVADRGIGVAEHELQLVFDRLYRSRDARVQALPGGGLGLTMARCIVTRHGGTIWATSEPNKGSIFTFRLPTAEA